MSRISRERALTFRVTNSVIGRSRPLFFLCIALTYGFVVSQLPDVHFKDFRSYLSYADSSWFIALNNADDGLLKFLINEPIWLLMNAGLGLFLHPEIVVRLIIFFGASSVAWLILRHYPQHFIWLILFLFLPQVIKNYLIHLRQGAAIAVFLWGWFAVNRFSRWLFMGLTPFIHASFFFILALFALTFILRFIRFGSDIKTLAYVAVGITCGLGLGVLAQLLDARQAEVYSFERAEVSGLGFVLWAMILGVMLSAEKKWLWEHAFESGLVTFYLVTYWLIEVAGRIFESGVIIVLLAGLTLKGWRRQVFLYIVVGSGVLGWMLRMGRPA